MSKVITADTHIMQISLTLYQKEIDVHNFHEVWKTFPYL